MTWKKRISRSRIAKRNARPCQQAHCSFAYSRRRLFSSRKWNSITPLYDTNGRNVFAIMVQGRVDSWSFRWITRRYSLIVPWMTAFRMKKFDCCNTRRCTTTDVIVKKTRSSRAASLWDDFNEISQYSVLCTTVSWLFDGGSILDSAYKNYQRH